MEIFCTRPSFGRILVQLCRDISPDRYVAWCGYIGGCQELLAYQLLVKIGNLLVFPSMLSWLASK